MKILECNIRSYNRGDSKLEYSAFDGGYFDPDKGTMYYITDWQGNNAAVVDKSGNIVQSTMYYPYGEPTIEPTGQRYLFAGKEREHAGGRNSYDFGARCLTPYGNWGVIDRYAEKFYPISPYSFCGGDPINRVDCNGEEWTDIYGNQIEDLSKIKRYIFYTDDFRSQAEIQYNDGVAQYGEGSVAMSNTGTTNGFSKDWSDINGQVKDVMIMAHGMNQSINVTNKKGDATNQLTSTGNGMTNGSKTKAVNIQDLGTPKGNINDATLYLYTCHSADNRISAHGTQFEMAGNKQTVLQAFSKTFDYKYVVGSHGSVNYYNIYLIILEGSLDFSKNHHPYPVNGEWIIQPNPRSGK